MGAAAAQVVERPDRQVRPHDRTDAATAAGIVDQQNAVLDQMDDALDAGAIWMNGATGDASVGAT